MSEPAQKKATYEDLYSIPEHSTGEIIDGELIVAPKPSPRHSDAEGSIISRLKPPFQFGEGGPGGWIILLEVEIMLGEHLLVPDLSGWRKERFPGLPKENWISVTPDWVCEILSPGTARLDRVRKMPIYAQHGVSYLWMVDPTERSMEVFKLEAGKWVTIAGFADDDMARAEPFHEIEINLSDFWGAFWME